MPESDLKDIISDLFRDLEISPDDIPDEGALSIKGELSDLLQASKGSHKVGLDLSLYAASLGDWAFALESVDRIIGKDLTSTAVYVWKMRCLVENGLYSEALAMVDSHEWPKDHLIHVKYLSGLSYLYLKMNTRARKSFEWVERQDSGYREVARLLAKV